MEFLDSIPLDQTALTVAMVGIVLLFAVISIIKGIIKTILTLISFTFATAAFLFGFLQSPPYIENFIPEAAGWMPLVAGVVCALLTMVVIQIFLGIFSGKSKKKKSVKAPNSSGSGDAPTKKRGNPLSGVFGLLMGIFALYGVITALRYYGTNAELAHLQAYVTEGSEKAGKTPLIAQAKQWLDNNPIAPYTERIDFLNTSDYRSRLNLAKLIIISNDQTDLAVASKAEDVKTALKVPEINSVTVTGDDLRNLCKDTKFSDLFNNEKFQRLTSRPSTRRALEKLNLEDFIPKSTPKEATKAK